MLCELGQHGICAARRLALGTGGQTKVRFVGRDRMDPRANKGVAQESGSKADNADVSYESDAVPLHRPLCARSRHPQGPAKRTLALSQRGSALSRLLLQAGRCSGAREALSDQMHQGWLPRYSPPDRSQQSSHSQANTRRNGAAGPLQYRHSGLTRGEFEPAVHLV